MFIHHFTRKCTLGLCLYDAVNETVIESFLEFVNGKFS